MFQPKSKTRKKEESYVFSLQKQPTDFTNRYRIEDSPKSSCFEYFNLYLC